MKRVGSDGVVAALPLAAAATLLLARVLPVRFEYVPNELGIVSLATLKRYPQQQETFWLLFSLLLATSLAWLLARGLRCAGASVAGLIAVEALAVGALVVQLWLPLAPATLLTFVAGGGALLLLGRVRTRGDAAASATTPKVGWPFERRPWATALFAAVVVVLALGLTPTFAVSLWNVASSLPDERRVVEGFVFQGEIGQHLAWANALWHGGFHGKHFFCLYGPLYDLGLVGVWKLFGRSIVAWDLYFAGTRVLAFAGLLLLTGSLLRRRALVLLLPFLVPWINLRVGFGLWGLLLLAPWLGGGGLRWVALAGATGGVSLLYSQEFGLAFAVTAGLAFALRRSARAALVFAGAALALMAPLLLWYAAYNSLGPMLHELLAYPGYLVAGYAKVPFPSLAGNLPLGGLDVANPRELHLRLGYAVPSILLAGLLLALPISRLDPRRPLASLRGAIDSLRDDPFRSVLLLCGVYGLLAFRPALGRSDVAHLIPAIPVAGLLLTVGCDRLLAGALTGPARWPLAAWRVATVALLVWLAGFPDAARPVRSLRRSVENIATLLAHDDDPRGAPRVTAVARWIQLHTEPTDYVAFLPNNAAYYYLADRPNPLRFVMGHQIVTEAHRREVLRDLQQQRPPYLVWDHDALRVDGIEDELVFGSELLDWIDASYETEIRFGSVEVLRLRSGT